MKDDFTSHTFYQKYPPQSPEIESTGVLSTSAHTPLLIQPLSPTELSLYNEKKIHFVRQEFNKVPPKEFMARPHKVDRRGKKNSEKEEFASRGYTKEGVYHGNFEGNRDNKNGYGYNNKYEGEFRRNTLDSETDGFVYQKERYSKESYHKHTADVDSEGFTQPRGGKYNKESFRKHTMNVDSEGFTQPRGGKYNKESFRKHTMDFENDGFVQQRGGQYSKESFHKHAIDSENDGFVQQRGWKHNKESLHGRSRDFKEDSFSRSKGNNQDSPFKNHQAGDGVKVHNTQNNTFTSQNDYLFGTIGKFATKETVKNSDKFQTANSFIKGSNPKKYGEGVNVEHDLCDTDDEGFEQPIDLKADKPDVFKVFENNSKKSGDFSEGEKQAVQTNHKDLDEVEEVKYDALKSINIPLSKETNVSHEIEDRDNSFSNQSVSEESSNQNINLTEEEAIAYKNQDRKDNRFNKYQKDHYRGPGHYNNGPYRGLKYHNDNPEFNRGQYQNNDSSYRGPKYHNETTEFYREQDQNGISRRSPISHNGSEHCENNNKGSLSFHKDDLNSSKMNQPMGQHWGNKYNEHSNSNFETFKGYKQYTNPNNTYRGYKHKEEKVDLNKFYPKSQQSPKDKLGWDVNIDNNLVGSVDKDANYILKEKNKILWLIQNDKFDDGPFTNEEMKLKEEKNFLKGKILKCPEISIEFKFENENEIFVENIEEIQKVYKKTLENKARKDAIDNKQMKKSDEDLQNLKSDNSKTHTQNSNIGNQKNRSASPDQKHINSNTDDSKQYARSASPERELMGTDSSGFKKYTCSTLSNKKHINTDTNDHVQYNRTGSPNQKPTSADISDHELITKPISKNTKQSTTSIQKSKTPSQQIKTSYTSSVKKSQTPPIMSNQKSFTKNSFKQNLRTENIFVDIVDTGIATTESFKKLSINLSNTTEQQKVGNDIHLNKKHSKQNKNIKKGYNNVDIKIYDGYDTIDDYIFEEFNVISNNNKENKKDKITENQIKLLNELTKETKKILNELNCKIEPGQIAIKIYGKNKKECIKIIEKMGSINENDAEKILKTMIFECGLSLCSDIDDEGFEKVEQIRNKRR